jgi:hypothetical protein
MRRTRGPGKEGYSLVFPAASSPSISRRISFDPKILAIILEMEPPMAVQASARSQAHSQQARCVCPVSKQSLPPSGARRDRNRNACPQKALNMILLVPSSSVQCGAMRCGLPTASSAGSSLPRKSSFCKLSSPFRAQPAKVGAGLCQFASGQDGVRFTFRSTPLKRSTRTRCAKKGLVHAQFEVQERSMQVVR